MRASRLRVLGGFSIAILSTGALWLSPRERPSRSRSASEAQDSPPARTDLVQVSERKSGPSTENENREGLEDLRSSLETALAEGRIAPEEILGRMMAEEDSAVLDILMGTLKADPPTANRADVLAAFLQMARAHPRKEHRQVATVFLAGAWDLDGIVHRTLLDVARLDGEFAVRLAAVAAFEEYSVRNPVWSGEVRTSLLALAAAEEILRERAIAALPMWSATEETIRLVAGFLSDGSAEVRRAAFDCLTRTPPTHRSLARSLVPDALRHETDPSLRR